MEPNQARHDVDFVVGTQYGDEGKGMIAKLLADRAEQENRPYTWTARVGAQNAEHRFIHKSCSFCARILPSASCYRDNILAILGAGHCFRPEQLPLEAIHLGVPLGRIFVDPQAMWLKAEHAGANLAIGNDRGTTGWGVGAAVAEKVRRKPGTKLVGDCDELRDKLGKNMRCASELVDEVDGPGLFEGSQGAMLSLNHGHYPHNSTKDVTVMGLCAELGLGYQRIRNVYGAVRAVMMRVPGPSGPTGGKEVSYDEIEGRTGLRLPHHTRLQGDTTRWRASVGQEQADEERLFDISIEELRKTNIWNNYTALVLTFTDYHRRGNYRVTKWEELHPDTKKLVMELERIAPVVLIRTGQGEHDNIWRM